MEIGREVAISYTISRDVAQACSETKTHGCFCSPDDHWPGRGVGERMPGASKAAALSIGLSLPDGRLVRNAA